MSRPVVFAWRNLVGERRWMCQSIGAGGEALAGTGRTPVDAYKSWRSIVDRQHPNGLVPAPMRYFHGEVPA